ncbi:MULTISPECIES: hypothetical protein [Rhizobium]|uniref:Uncharacterized protein n=1 Tax=Rhizobium rhododendri TaxID=2506430 RepID=A0ABY8IED9_9HYPH|nr:MULTISPECIES: hypothetical protein [Rhizobium]MBZ5758584.1 hypothetical protein [Rhizobium sp. VS19-DR96]MBZ5764586.1 hypothetical protein [Rhizobium sp. VS19-DR129.2]MBZ5772129.1 hypothetical protein [Rhizobium sp. VS19-DRK62.2]MBZ5783184.1 hypothetical protein [Rhizobium sp. VS19-DR121]MBZ5800632.1 hypothetical protein [Rhizobium sp. VS19-DR181]
MLNTTRDCARDSAKNAIPSLGEIEGRLAVLEILAQCALTHALSEGDQKVDKALLEEIRRAMHAKCGELKLGSEDAESAFGFAEELISASIEASRLNRQ